MDKMLGDGLEDSFWVFWKKNYPLIELVFGLLPLEYTVYPFHPYLTEHGPEMNWNVLWKQTYLGYNLKNLSGRGVFYLQW